MPDSVEALDRAEAAKTYIPGVWRCAKCNFRLVQSTLNARDGTVTARDEPGEPCPNCKSPLWRVSWKDEAQENLALAENQIERAVRAEAQRDALQAFKDFVHRRLDEAGVPTHPEGPHSAAGCRIGDRLDIVLGALAQRDALAKALTHAGETFRHYARLHRAKGTADGLAKASINDELAEQCEAALAAAAEGNPK